MLLKDKVAVISGAASPRGIGLATAKLFAQHGATVAILDLDEAGAQRAAVELGPNIVALFATLPIRQVARPRRGGSRLSARPISCSPTLASPSR